MNAIVILNHPHIYSKTLFHILCSFHAFSASSNVLLSTAHIKIQNMMQKKIIFIAIILSLMFLFANIQISCQTNKKNTETLKESVFFYKYMSFFSHRNQNQYLIILFQNQVQGYHRNCRKIPKRLLMREHHHSQNHQIQTPYHLQSIPRHILQLQHH